MFLRTHSALVGIGLIVSAGFCSSPASAQLIGPSPDAATPYLSFADSPFNGGVFSSFYLEDFEDHLLNVPGVSADFGGVTSVVFGPNIHDSVDGDDGVFDGSGLQGDSYFYNAGSQGVTFTFNPNVLGFLPSHAGIVWTDGVGPITFEAFDQNGVSLGTVIGNHSNNSFNGEAADDRFYGIVHPGGVSALKVSNASGGIEVDHLQYGRLGQVSDVPEPGMPALLAAIALSGGGLYLRRRRA